MITKYPNFVRYWPGDIRETTPLRGLSTEPCHDKFFDGRPGFVPLIFPLFGRGIRDIDAARANEFLDPLNEAIDKLGVSPGAHKSGLEKGRFGWTVVSQHVEDGRGNGFCSLDRWYNTYVDSLWNQGNKPLADRPLGNFRVGRANNLRVDGLPVPEGAAVVWSASESCFVLLDHKLAPTKRCVHDSQGYDPVFYEMTRKIDPKVRNIARPGIEKNKFLAFITTTGPVHPNLFGQCNYAAALVTAVARTEALSKKLDQRWRTDIDKQPLDTEQLCHPKAWGYKLTRGAKVLGNE
jgi:hypothetical protein